MPHTEALPLATVFQALPPEVVSLILSEIEDANKLFVALESTAVFTANTLSFVRLVSDMPIGSCSRLSFLENRAKALTPYDLLAARAIQRPSKNVLYLCELSPAMSMDSSAVTEFLETMKDSNFYLVVHFDALDKTKSTPGFDTLLNSTMMCSARSVILDVKASFNAAVLIDKLPSTITDKVIITGKVPFLDVANYKGNTTSGQLRFEDANMEELIVIGSHHTIDSCWKATDKVDYLLLKSNLTTGVQFEKTTVQDFIIDMELLNGEIDTCSFKNTTFRKGWSSMDIQMAYGDGLVFQEPKSPDYILKLELFKRPTLNAPKTHYSIRSAQLINTTIRAPKVKITSVLMFPYIRNTKFTGEKAELIFESKSIRGFSFYDDKMTRYDVEFLGQFHSLILVNLEAARSLCICGTRQWWNISKIAIDLCTSKTSADFTKFYLDDSIKDFRSLEEFRMLFPKAWTPCIPGWELPRLRLLSIDGYSPFVNATELMMAASKKFGKLETLEIGVNVTSMVHLDKRHDVPIDKSMIGTPFTGLKELKLSLLEGNQLAVFSFPDLVKLSVENVSFAAHKGIISIDAPVLESVLIIYKSWEDKGPLPRLVVKSPNKVKEITTHGIQKVIVVPKSNTPEVINYGEFRGYRKPVAGVLTDLGNGVRSQRFELGSLRVQESQDEVINQLVHLLVPEAAPGLVEQVLAGVRAEGDADPPGGLADAEEQNEFPGLDEVD